MSQRKMLDRLIISLELEPSLAEMLKYRKSSKLNLLKAVFLLVIKYVDHTTALKLQIFELAVWIDLIKLSEVVLKRMALFNLYSINGFIVNHHQRID